MERMFNKGDIKIELLEIEYEENLNKLLSLEITFNIKDELNKLLSDIESERDENKDLVSEIRISLAEIKESRKETYDLLATLSQNRTYEETELLLKKVNHKVALLEAKKLKLDLFANRDLSSMFKEEIDMLIKKIDDKIASLSLENENGFYEEKIKMLLDSEELESLEEKTEINVVEVVKKPKEDVSTEVTPIQYIPDPELKKEEESENLDKLINYLDGKITNLEQEYKKETEESREYRFFDKETDITEFEPTNQSDLDMLFNPFAESNEVKEVPIEEPETEDLPRMDTYISPLTRDEVDVFIKRIDDKLAELKAEEDKIGITRFDIPINE